MPPIALFAIQFTVSLVAFALIAAWYVLPWLATANAVVESIRYDVFGEPLGVNWVIVTTYVPALVVSSVLIVLRLLRPDPTAVGNRE